MQTERITRTKSGIFSVGGRGSTCGFRLSIGTPSPRSTGSPYVAGSRVKLATRIARKYILADSPNCAALVGTKLCAGRWSYYWSRLGLSAARFLFGKTPAQQGFLCCGWPWEASNRTVGVPLFGWIFSDRLSSSK